MRPIFDPCEPYKRYAVIIANNGMHIDARFIIAAFLKINLVCGAYIGQR